MKKIEANGIPFYIATGAYIIYLLLYEHNGRQSALLLTIVTCCIIVGMILGNLFLFNMPKKTTYWKMFGKTFSVNDKVLTLLLVTLLMALYAVFSYYIDLLIVCLVTSGYYLTLMSIKLSDNNPSKITGKSEL